MLVPTVIALVEFPVSDWAKVSEVCTIKEVSIDPSKALSTSAPAPKPEPKVEPEPKAASIKKKRPPHSIPDLILGFLDANRSWFTAAQIGGYVSQVPIPEDARAYQAHSVSSTLSALAAGKAIRSNLAHRPTLDASVKVKDDK